MKYLPVLVAIVLGAMATSCSAQVEFRLAYKSGRPGALPAVFPNDQRYQFMAATPYLAASELGAASVSRFERRAVVLLSITEAGRKQFNRLAAANVKALAGPDDGRTARPGDASGRASTFGVGNGEPAALDRNAFGYWGRSTSRLRSAGQRTSAR